MVTSNDILFNDLVDTYVESHWHVLYACSRCLSCRNALARAMRVLELFSYGGLGGDVSDTIE